MTQNRDLLLLNEPSTSRVLGSRMRRPLELISSPVGGDYSLMKKEGLAGAHTLTHYRYCQAVMKARKGW
jgi:uncharacterized protein (DUF169 family)